MSRLRLAINPGSPPASDSIWPIRASVDGRYLTDNTAAPFFLVGDSSLQSILFSLSDADVTTVLNTRQSQGFNASWSHLYGTFAPSVHGQPFSPMTDVSSINESYFVHIDSMLNLMKARGIVCFFDVAGSNGMVDPAFYNNGTTKLRAFGTFLGQRYKNQGNIIWTIGNDWEDWNVAVQNDAMLALADGIRTGDGGLNLMTVEIYRAGDGTPALSSDISADWDQYLGMNLEYDYGPSWVTAKRSWSVSPHLPCVGFEYLYEDSGSANDFNNGRHGYLGTPWNLRKNQYWGVLYGTIGGTQYGNEAYAGFVHSDLTLLNSTGATQFKNLKQLFSSRKWYALIPDHAHTIGTGGLGAFQVGAQNLTMENMEATTLAATADGTLCIAYMERRRDLTINMGKLANNLSAQWFNPENGAYQSGGGPFTNTGSRVFSPPTRSGDNDWVLVLE